MRVKDRQKRANEAFTKRLTTHLTRDKGDFSCREGFFLKFTLNEFLRVSDLSMIKFCSSKKVSISKAL